MNDTNEIHCMACGKSAKVLRRYNKSFICYSCYEKVSLMDPNVTPNDWRWKHGEAEQREGQAR